MVMKVRELMSDHVETCLPATSLTDAAMAMWRRDCGIMPVVRADDGRLVGVITDRDICIATATRHTAPENVRVGEVMQTDIATCRPDEDIADALDSMRLRQVRRLPAVDANNKIVGLLSLNDIVQHAEPMGTKGRPTVPSEEVMLAFKSICAPRGMIERELPSQTW